MIAFKKEGLMSEYLDYLDNEFSKKKPSDYYISDLFFKSFPDDEIYSIILKYGVSSYKFNSFTLNEKESKLILEECNKDHHLIVLIFLNYLLSFSSYREQSKLIELCKNLVCLCFTNDEEEDGLLQDTFNTVISWSCFKFPNHKQELSDFILNEMKSRNDCKKNMCFFYSWISDEHLKNLFPCEKLSEIHETNFPKFDCPDHVYVNIEIFKEFLKYLEEQKKKEFLYIFQRKYIDFIFKNLSTIDSRKKCILLQQILDLMRKIKYRIDEIQIIENDLKNANNDCSKDFESITIPFNDEIKESLKKGAEISEAEFEDLSNTKKIILLLTRLNPFRLNEIKNSVNTSHKQFWNNIVPTLYSDSEGRILNYKKLDDTQMFSIEAREHIIIHIDLTFSLVINPFYRHFQLDNQSNEFIEKIIKNNYLIRKADTQRISCLFKRFLNKEFEDSSYQIIEMFEAGLRSYFENSNISIFNLNGDRIGLSDIFNYKDKNAYRDKLFEIIDEDFYFTLTWLLTDHYGEDLRNRIVHNYNNDHLYELTSTIYAVLQILRLYYGYMKDSNL